MNPQTSETSANPNNLAWGLKNVAPPGNYLAAWGARAIFQNGNLDFLPDRQDCLGDLTSRKILRDWMNGTALKELKRKIKKDHWNGSTREIFTHCGNFCRMWASPQGSHGYMNITAALNGTRTIPEGKWSSDNPIPEPGKTVTAKINGIGKCKVIGYDKAAGWIYIICRPIHPPEWLVSQNGRKGLVSLFGAEIE